MATNTCMSSTTSPESILTSSIVLDEYQFPPQPNHHIGLDGFAELANKTFRRYEESNRRIDSFSLRLKTESYAQFGLVTEWTSNALKLGATYLTFRSDHPYDIALPLNRAVFKNPVHLNLQGLKINNMIRSAECPRLKSLALSDLTIGPGSFFDLISCCLSVENLSLSNISWEKSNVPPPNFILPELRSLDLRVKDVDSQIRVKDVDSQIKTLFLDDLSAKCPNLKTLFLGLSLYLRQKVENISSPSLESLNIMDMHKELSRHQRPPQRVLRAEFDVPSIRKFAFQGRYIPDVSFKSIPSGHQWESYASIISHDGLGNEWFRQLSNFLTQLRGSKIHLFLHLRNRLSFDYDVGELEGLNACEVEDLTLDIKCLPSLSCHALLDGLFRICRPKMITQYAKPPDNKNYNDYGLVKSTRNYDLFICLALERAMQEKSRLVFPSQFMYGLRDLEGIVAQELVGEVWKTRPFGSILADHEESDKQQQKKYEAWKQQQQQRFKRRRWDLGSTSQKSKTRFRLQLKWKPFVITQ